MSAYIEVSKVQLAVHRSGEALSFLGVLALGFLDYQHMKVAKLQHYTPTVFTTSPTPPRFQEIFMVKAKSNPGTTVRPDG